MTTSKTLHSGKDRESGLGADFARSVLVAIDSLQQNALLYPIRERRRNVRWLLLDRFPYGLFYRITHDLVTVFAIIHSSRHERQWRKRL